MGQVKQRMLEIESQGYDASKNKNVGESQLPNQRILQEIIRNNGTVDLCSYSGKQERVISFGSFMEYFYDAFTHIFEDPAEELPFESGGEWEELEGSGMHKEGSGYILPDGKSIMTTREALGHVGFRPLSEELFDDVESSIINDDWVVKDAFVGTDDERMQSLWDGFWKNTINDFRNGVMYNDLFAKYSSTFTFISESIASNMYSLTRTFKKGEVFYRCVNYKDVPNPMLASNLWAPPAEYASSQRMSSEGQSRLYVSFDRETPIKEAVSMTGTQHHCLGVFSLTQDIEVLDFSEIPVPNILNVPDFFAYRFFYDFAKAITKDVKDDKTLYVPTQLMRDIIEQGFRGSGILGIIYRSVKGDNTKNMVLFLDNKTCENYLKMESYEVDPE